MVGTLGGLLKVMQSFLFIGLIFLLSVVSRLGTFFLPFKWISILFLKNKCSSDNHCSEFNLVPLSKVIYKVSRKVPWRFMCLEQAIVARIFLNLKGVPNIVYFGFKKEEELTKAHAWLKVNDFVVTGESGYEEYKVIAKFH